jgi:hypothetical protein
MNRLKFSYFSDFFQTREEYGNLENPLVEGTVNSMEQRTRVFCKIDVQECHLWNESRRSEDSREKREVRQHGSWEVAGSRGFAAGSIVGLVAQEMLQGAGPRFEPWTGLAEDGLANNGINLTKLS